HLSSPSSGLPRDRRSFPTRRSSDLGIDRLIKQDVSDEELKMVKRRIRADLIRSLADNEGLAQNLGTIQARYGDWRELFRQVDRVDKVSKADIRRVAAKVFTAQNRTLAVTETAAAPAPQGGQ